MTGPWTLTLINWGASHRKVTHTLREHSLSHWWEHKRIKDIAHQLVRERRREAIRFLNKFLYIFPDPSFFWHCRENDRFAEKKFIGIWLAVRTKCLFSFSFTRTGSLVLCLLLVRSCEWKKIGNGQDFFSSSFIFHTGQIKVFCLFGAGQWKIKKEKKSTLRFASLTTDWAVIISL